ANVGIINMLTANSITLPRYILAISPQANSGFCSMSKGPGCKPHIRNPANRTAVAPDPGIPIVINGTIAPTEAALLAASGPATPSTAPLPKRSGRLETAFSTLYDINDATVAPAPGATPTTKPKKDPLTIGAAESLYSLRLGQKLLLLNET